MRRTKIQKICEYCGKEFATFSQVRTLKEQGKLPEEFGKDVRG